MRNVGLEAIEVDFGCEKPQQSQIGWWLVEGKRIFFADEESAKARLSCSTLMGGGSIMPIQKGRMITHFISPGTKMYCDADYSTDKETLIFVRKTTIDLDQIWNSGDITLSVYRQGCSFPCCNIWVCSWIMRKAKQRKPILWTVVLEK